MLLFARQQYYADMYLRQQGLPLEQIPDVLPNEPDAKISESFEGYSC